MRTSTCTRRTSSARELGRGACDLASTGSSVHRYYDPVTAQFISVDPALSVTGQPYSYAGGDPVNGVDPLGLWGWNPVADVNQAWGDTGGKAVSWVKAHPADVGLALGGIALAATGVGLFADGAVITLAAGGVATASGLGAAHLDQGACVDTGSAAACIGMTMGYLGSTVGGAGAFADGVGQLKDIQWLSDLGSTHEWLAGAAGLSAFGADASGLSSGGRRCG